MKKHIIFTAGALLLAFASCKSPDGIPDVESAYCPSDISIVLPSQIAALLYEDSDYGVTLPLLKGESVIFGYEIQPDTATFYDVVWVSSFPETASVNENGEVKALSGAGFGYSVISVTPKGMYSGSGVTASLCVRVSDELRLAETITVAPKDTNSDGSLFIGDTLHLAVSISPIDATYRTVTWKSADESVATVDANGLVTGVSTHAKLSESVDIIATAMDGSGVVGKTSVRVKNVVDPEKVTIDTQFDKDHYACCMSDLTVELAYTTYPEESTFSKIQWESSDPDIATVIGGVVYLNQNGQFGDFTITATCPNGESDQITMSMPAGLVRETFDNKDNLTWGIDNMDKQVWHEEGYITCTTTATSADAQRADFKAKKPVYIYTANYPIVALRMDYVLDKYEDVTSCSFKFDTNGADVERGTAYAKEIGGGNNKWTARYKCSDGSSVFIYDLSKLSFPTGGVLPPTALVKFTTFQIKYADIKSIDHEIDYNAYWVQSFKTMDDLKAALEAEGLTWTE